MATLERATSTRTLKNVIENDRHIMTARIRKHNADVDAVRKITDPIHRRAEQVRLDVEGDELRESARVLGMVMKRVS
jgi:hypothetical protein